jgi:DNA repair exonuclease SbcCD ATPase subunit
MAGADEEISRLRHQVADAQERLDGGTLELQERDATLLLLREQLEGAQEKVEEFAKEREGHASELAGLRGLVVDAERRCEDADARARALRAELGMVTEKLNGKEDEVSRVNKMLKEIQHALERGAEDIKRKDGELERLQRLQSDTQSRLVESQRAVADRVKTAEDRATAAETAERSLRSRQGTESEERKSVMADMARDLQTLRGELSTKEVSRLLGFWGRTFARCGVSKTRRWRWCFCRILDSES